ncbi:MAG: ThiF family adenylyltransferase [Deltaproteobacteria bacterium]|nr:ThiF family adenylyltransferase [Deltaproteobacteria bacterium]
MSPEAQLHASIEHLTPDKTSWEPARFRLKNKEDEIKWGDLCREVQPLVRVDAFLEQLKELVTIRNPKHQLTEQETEEAAKSWLEGRSPEKEGVWVFYPWRRCVVHVLDEREFGEVRLSRNRYKIFPEEQARLARAKVGIIGLSVGQSIALTMAQEGVGGCFRLADFDTLSLANLNRISGSVCDQGVNKAVMTARRIFEIDPFASVQIFPRGFDDEMQETFLGTDEETLDLLIEECDDLYTKIRARELARDKKIPVLMDTNDRGLLDVERFDLETNRPILHGLLGDTPSDALKNLSPKEKVPFVVSILGAQSMSKRAATSFAEIGASITGWPQLASGTTLGAALACDTARRILLGTFNASGRFYVDLDELIPSNGV